MKYIFKITRKMKQFPRKISKIAKIVTFLDKNQEKCKKLLIFQEKCKNFSENAKFAQNSITLHRIVYNLTKFE